MALEGNMILQICFFTSHKRESASGTQDLRNLKAYVSDIG